MLFNSYTFILLFLPATLLGFFVLGKLAAPRLAQAWLTAASLGFYAYWNPKYLALIVAEVIVNYGIGVWLAKSESRWRKAGLVAGIAGNLAVLCWFKYTNFFLGTWHGLTGAAVPVLALVLPLGISFHTFQQIAYLVDAHKRRTEEFSFLNYLLFVTFFPQLLAGPIVHHRDLVPQFLRREIYRFDVANFSVGLSIFIVGLFKKVVIADTAALYATPVFNAAAAGTAPTFLDGWAATFAYGFQLYFDFSGYSDMAVGLARMFNIHLPWNFRAPYQAVDISDFWRRWHITLSTWLRDYLYIPLGGNRHGSARRYANLMVTMLLGGLWHGAGWQFVLWGGLHGAFLCVHQAWRKWTGLTMPGWLGRTLTFLAVNIAWVFFRARDFPAASRMLCAMCGLEGVSLPRFLSSVKSLRFLKAHGVKFKGWLADSHTDAAALWLLLALLLAVWLLPPAPDLFARFSAVENSGGAHRARWGWRPSAGWALLLALCGVWAFLNLARVSEFLYFQF